ncbi:MAG: NAD-dependent epimerase/dehydratase family protein [Thermocrispum sp.]
MSGGVFVTGGSGFIGGKLVERLVADGHAVRALARSERAAERVAELGAEPVRGELSDVESLVAACTGAELAFHAAAKAESGGPWKEFVAANVDGTRNVLEACRRAGVRRLVHVGTEAALMAGRPLVNVDETAPLQPESPAPYPATKAQAERLVLDAQGLETVVVRPRFVWGAGDTTLLPAMADMVRAGKFAWIGGGRQQTDVAHVGNVVHALQLAAERGKPGEAYFVTDGEPTEFRSFVTELLDTQGVSAPAKSIPVPVAKALAVAARYAFKVLPGEPPVDLFTVWVSSQECTIDITKARTELGYAPVVSRAEGLAALRS